jgi:hypothetical protein
VEFLISDNGVRSKVFGAAADPVDIHVLPACPDCDEPPGQRDLPRAVTHADGTLVSAASPATAGELVVIYATGLGETDPDVPLGQATPDPPPLVRKYFYLLFDFSPNARPRVPDHNPFARPFAPTPEFVGLTPGQVGLYQINVRIPDTIPPVPPCRVDAVEGVNVISNLTITVGTGASFYNNLDGAAICVAPQ